MIELKEDDVVFCEVKKIEGTTVFLKIEGEIEGSMILSEVAAGRIRNLREYVSPGKKVVCKVLNVVGNHVELSLRRVTAKERQQVIERHKRERAMVRIFSAVGENGEKIVEQIGKEYDIEDFLHEIKSRPVLLEKFVQKQNVKKIIEAVSEKVERAKEVVQVISLKSFSETGASDIKKILDVEAEIHYFGSGKFSVKIRGEDFKQANATLEKILEEIEKRARQKKALFEIVKEK